MSIEFEQQLEDLVNAKWDAGDYEQEFDKWCSEEMLHKDDWPDYIDDFLQSKYDQLMEEVG